MFSFYINITDKMKRFPDERHTETYHVLSYTYILFWLTESSMGVKTYQLSFHVLFYFIFHLETSSFFQ